MLTRYDSETRKSTSRKMSLGRLRLMSFRGPPPDPTFTTDHISRDRSDDDIDNLRWSSKSEQCLNRNKIERTGSCAAVKRTHLETGVTETFMSATHVPNVKHSTVLYRVYNKSIIDGWRWGYDALTVERDEEFRKIGDSVWASNMGRLAVKKGDEYIGVTLSSKTRYQRVVRGGKVTPIHRAVFEAFSGRKLEKHEVVDHIDENPSNFVPSNLRAVTNAENLKFASAFMYDVKNKLTGETFTVAGLKSVAERCGVSERRVSNYSCGARCSETWEVNKRCRFLHT